MSKEIPEPDIDVMLASDWFKEAHKCASYAVYLLNTHGVTLATIGLPGGSLVLEDSSRVN